MGRGAVSVWLVLTLLVSIFVLSFSFVGDGLDDADDPYKYRSTDLPRRNHHERTQRP